MRMSRLVLSEWRLSAVLTLAALAWCGCPSCAAEDDAAAALGGRPLVFVVRPQYAPDHHNTETMFQTGEINTNKFQGGGAIKVVDFARGGAVQTLLAVPKGVARDLEVSFDGRKLLFAMRRDCNDDYHLYEMRADGTQLKQLTFGTGVSDLDPIYLPDGRILFTSTREPKYCMCNRHIMGNLYVMEGDGSNLRQISHNTLHDGHAALLPDGRVLYDRWEYVDRNFGDNQGLWTCRPDGTNHAVYFGAHMRSPGVLLDARPLPDGERVIVTVSSCHDRPWGALAVLDRRLGVDGKPAFVHTWPAEARNLVEVGHYDTFRQLKIKFEDPYPLSDELFLCARMTGQGEQMGIYLVGLDGREQLLYSEAPGCYDPMPLGPRRRPPIVPDAVDLRDDEGRFYVADVYQGSGMEAVARGSVRWLRVVESPEKRFWTPDGWNGSGTQAPGMAWDDFNNKRILGDVPVEPDGSAYFSVPADAFVYFQLLDERGMMVQTMRSAAMVRPGETTGCVGCHEHRLASPPRGGGAAAVRRGPSPLQPWRGPPRNFGYVAEVQPVFDKHCVSCHDYGKDAGKKLNLAGDLGLIFNTSYVELRSKNYVKVVGAGPAEVLRPKSWGSHASRLVEVLLRGHGDPEVDRQVKLDAEGFDRIVAWIDINAPYYPEYSSAYRDSLWGRSPLGREQLDELSRLTGADMKRQESAARVSFSRPEASLCLAKFADRNDPAYQRALAIIRAGQAALAERPRDELPGCGLQSPLERQQQARYEARQREAAEMRRAIVAREKRFTEPD